MELHKRPNPDELLKAVQQEETGHGRGRLKIFFGACAGVGKTYAMLSAARDKMEDGLSVLIGIAETHGRPETEELLRGLEILPRREVEHRGVKLKEFDLDAALKAKPVLIIVDELPHTNAPGSRHTKRWMDIEELLAAGIDVYTALNVQHLESMNDLVASITGIRVKETVPDPVFDNADDITLVDIPSDELLERLREGKVYVTDLGKKQAAENFFKRENLFALRELALRRTAERVARKEVVTSQPERRSATERLAVCIGAGDLSPKLLRATKRLADGLNAPWVALYVENTHHYRMGKEAQRKVESNLKLAEELGGKTEVLHQEHAASAIIQYAKQHNITKIVVGKANKSRFAEILYGSLAGSLLRRSGSIDVHIISGEETPAEPSTQETKNMLYSWRIYVGAITATAGATVIGLPFRDYFQAESSLLLYLIGIVFVAARYGWLSSVIASILAFLSYNFFYTQPYYSFTIDYHKDLLTVILLLVTGIIAGSQTSRLYLQSRYFQRKERNTSALYAMSRELAATRGQENILKVISKHLEQAIDGSAIIWIIDSGTLSVAYPTETRSEVKEESVVQWVLQHQQPAGLGTATMPSARGYYLPLKGSGTVLGVAGVIPNGKEKQFTQEQEDLLDALATLAASALERAETAVLAEERKVEAESEKMRNVLLSSVSHDLRTPLASIKGNISLMLNKGKLTDDARQELVSATYEEITRLEKIVSNLLDITLLESGKLTLNRDYYFVPELVGNTIKRVQPGKRQLITLIGKDLPAVWVDGLLIEQVLFNLLENAIKYTPDKATIVVRVKQVGENIRVQVEDDGKGISPGQENRIFDKFYSLADAKGKKSSGLGLAICRGIMKAHESNITVGNRPEGGAIFTFDLPVKALPKEGRE